MKILSFILMFSAITLYAQIKFDAEFESGNLNSVSTTDSINYTITSNQDIGGRWFYYRISGVMNKTISVTISNSDVNRPIYSYDNQNFLRFSASEGGYNYFKKKFTQDTVFISYYTPYTFSHLQRRIKEWQKSPYVTSIDTLGFTQKSLPIQEIIVTNPFSDNSQKEHIWIHARTHPGETPSSFHFDGIMQALLENKDVPNFYLNKLVFHMIPFTNPDGVYYGRSRTNYNYVDVEREWDKDSSATCLEVQAMKARMWQINNETPIRVFLNLHSQAASFCTFWIHTASSTSDKFYQNEYQFSNLNTSDNPYFSPNDYSESSLKSYFPEGFLWKVNGSKTMALTYETPYDQYSSGDWVTDENLIQIGKRTLYAIGEYLQLSNDKHLILDNNNFTISGTGEVNDSSGLDFFGNNFTLLPEGQQDVVASTTTNELAKGNYDIYAWWPEDNNYAYSANFQINYDNKSEIIQKTQRTNGGQWNFIKNIDIQNSSPLNIKVFNTLNGLTAVDAFRIIYRGDVVSINDEFKPSNFELYQNYPNPFNPTTTIRFELKQNSRINLIVYDILGQKVAELADSIYSKGIHEIQFSPSQFGLASGIYYYKLILGNNSLTKGMVFLK